MLPTGGTPARGGSQKQKKARGGSQRQNKARGGSQRRNTGIGWVAEVELRRGVLVAASAQHLRGVGCSGGYRRGFGRSISSAPARGGLQWRITTRVWSQHQLKIYERWDAASFQPCEGVGHSAHKK